MKVGFITSEVWSGLRRDVDHAADLTHGPSLGHRTRELLKRQGTPRIKEVVTT